MTEDPEKEWLRIDRAGNKGLNFLKEGEVKEVEVDGRKLCIVREGERCYAINSRCPHNGAAMENGFVEPGGIITCPLHRFRFSLETGKNVSGEGFYLANYPLEIRKDGMFVQMPKKKKWGWF